MSEPAPRTKQADVDQRLEELMRRLAYALSNREAADTIKELIETILERRT